MCKETEKTETPKTARVKLVFPGLPRFGKKRVKVDNKEFEIRHDVSIEVPLNIAKKLTRLYPEIKIVEE